EEDFERIALASTETGQQLPIRDVTHGVAILTNGCAEAALYCNEESKSWVNIRAEVRKKQAKSARVSCFSQVQKSCAATVREPALRRWPRSLTVAAPR